MKIVSFNSDTNISLLEGTELRNIFPKWRVAKRLPFIIHYLLEEADADIICLQELRKFVNDDGELVDPISPIKSALENEGFQVSIDAYNECGGEKAFQYLTAYRTKFSLVSKNMVYFTKTGDLLRNR